MRRHKTSKSAAIPARKPMGFPEQLIGMLVVLFALLIYVLSDEYPRQLPVGLLSAVIVLSLLAYRRPKDVNLAFELSTETPALPCPVDKVEVDMSPTGAVDAPMPAEPRRLYKDAIAEIGTRHLCKFELGLSPLVFGPEPEVMAIIDACLPADSLCYVTARSREIVLLGRIKYAGITSKCSQKRFVKAVTDAHDSMRVKRNLPKLGLSSDIFCGTLTGRNSSLEARLTILMPVDADAQLTLL